MRSSGVSWGRPQAAPAAASAAADGTSASIADADATLFELDAEDGMNPQLLDDADLVHVAKRPDYGRYLWHVDLAFDPKSAGRLIVVGDVHGMVGSLRTLLDALRFDKAVDQLVLAGDIVSKAPAISASLDTIKLARKMGAESVRGNHDQAVIGWRAWMDAFGYVVGEAIGDDDDATHADSSWLQSTAPPASVKPKIPKGALGCRVPSLMPGRMEVAKSAFRDRPQHVSRRLQVAPRSATHATHPFAAYLRRPRRPAARSRSEERPPSSPSSR